MSMGRTRNLKSDARAVNNTQTGLLQRFRGACPQLLLNKVHAAGRGQEVGVGVWLGNVAGENVIRARVFVSHYLGCSADTNNQRHLFAEVKTTSATRLRTSQRQAAIPFRPRQEFARVDVACEDHREEIFFRRIDCYTPDIRIRSKIARTLSKIVFILLAQRLHNLCRIRTGSGIYPILS